MSTTGFQTVTYQIGIVQHKKKTEIQYHQLLTAGGKHLRNVQRAFDIEIQEGECILRVC